MNIKKKFSQKDLDEIEQAVKNAESKTSGEIVPYISKCSDLYEDTIWMYGVVAFIVNLLVFTFLKARFPFLADSKIYLSMILGVTLLFIMLLRIFPKLRVILTVYDKKKKRTAMAARDKFLSEEVFNTKERTGILIYISLLEKRVEIIGDSGINAKVEQSQWDNIVDIIVKGMKKRNYTQSLIEAINCCGNLLQQSNVERRVDDTNELSDKVRFDN